ncbi:MAG: SPOR domain-containing protein [Saprospiraceae bacterium]
MGKTVTYFVLALVIILGLTYMATQAESCAKKSPTIIHANDISADNEDDKPVESIEDEDDEPMDEHNDATTGSITSDEDADDDEVIPLEGDEDEIIGKDDDEEEIVPTNTSSSGDYLVIAGAFKSEANAQTEVDRLKSSGYPNAEIVEFDFSDYYSVCVAKYNTSEDANAVANSIKSKSGKKAYVHKKRDKK